MHPTSINRILAIYLFFMCGGRGRTRSRFMVSIALSMPLTTLVMFPVTCRIVVAVSTRLATASIRLASRSKLSDSLFLRIALAAYIRAPSLLPCCNACNRLRSTYVSMYAHAHHAAAATAAEPFLLSQFWGEKKRSLPGRARRKEEGGLTDFL